MKRISLMLVMLLMLSGITYSQERGGGQRPSAGTQERGGGQRPSAGSQERGGGQRPSRDGQARPGNGGGFMNMTPEQRLQRQTQMLVEQLKLNKDQEQKVMAINKKYQEKQSFDWSKMRDASDDERAKMRDDMMKVQAEKDKEIKTVLTPDQVKQYDDILKKRAEMMRNGQGRWGGGGGGQRQ